jgi:transposase
LADGVTYTDIQEQLGVPASAISRWKKRYQQQGLVGLGTVHPGQAPRLLTAALRAKILNKIKEAPPGGSTHWSVRKMAKALEVGKDLVHKMFKELDLRPHRLDRYKASDDPDFEQKATDIIGLYLNPPQHAAVYQQLSTDKERRPGSKDRASEQSANSLQAPILLHGRIPSASTIRAIASWNSECV